MTLEPERDNPNNIRTKLAQHVQVARKMAALSSDWSAPYATSNAGLTCQTATRKTATEKQRPHNSDSLTIATVSSATAKTATHTLERLIKTATGSTATMKNSDYCRAKKSEKESHGQYFGRIFAITIIISKFTSITLR